MKLNPFRRRPAPVHAPAPEPNKQPFEAPAPPWSARETPSRMYSLMLPSFTDRR
jgi:hypothetical protein